MGRLLGKFFGVDYVQEIPSGTVNGSNTTFTLSQTPASVSALIIFVNGILQIQSTDYSVSGTTVTLTTAPTVAQSVSAFYVKAS